MSLLNALLIIFTILLQYQAYSASTYTITDLTANDVSFACQAGLWTSNNQRTTNIFSKCGSTYILGGYNVLGGQVALLTGLLSPTVNGDYYQRIYTDIPSHNLIQFSFTLWAIDYWLSTSTFKVQFDTATPIDGFTLTYSNFPSNLCGNSLFNDFQPVYVYGTAVHSASTLTLKILHYLGQDSATSSLGIRDLSLQFITTASTGSNGLCAKASISIPAAAQCACSIGQYKASSGSCTACNSSCASCYGPSASQCYTCATGYLFNGVQCILCDPACSFCYGQAFFSLGDCLPFGRQVCEWQVQTKISPARMADKILNGRQGFEK